MIATFNELLALSEQLNPIKVLVCPVGVRTTKQIYFTSYRALFAKIKKSNKSHIIIFKVADGYYSEFIEPLKK